ncbi:MAG TPA: hypothetical protein PKN58_00045 [Candidatus Marinimicrobia bacterium]|jgi:hypothetical protein|nr:hypothetical protein [Candidatus Neomarinimicrobiota bacterium]
MVMLSISSKSFFQPGRAKLLGINIPHTSLRAIGYGKILWANLSAIACEVTLHGTKLLIAPTIQIIAPVSDLEVTEDAQDLSLTRKESQ